MNQLLLQQECKDGKIYPEHKPDAIDWLFTIIGFMAIEALPVGGLIASWIAGIVPAIIMCAILVVGLPYMVISAERGGRYG